MEGKAENRTARALYKNSNIIIFDEVSCFDNETEKVKIVLIN